MNRKLSDQCFVYMFKLFLIGNSSGGKASFLFRYADNSFSSAFVATVGIDFRVKTVFRHDKRVKLQIWDNAGQERYRTITTAYYRGAMGFILMYDIKNYSWDNAQVVLVGNKCDLEDDEVISTARGQQLADTLGRPNSRWRPKMAAPTIIQMARQSQIVSPTCSWAPDRGRDISDQATEQW